MLVIDVRHAPELAKRQECAARLRVPRSAQVRATVAPIVSRLRRASVGDSRRVVRRILPQCVSSTPRGGHDGLPHLPHVGRVWNGRHATFPTHTTQPFRVCGWVGWCGGRIAPGPSWRESICAGARSPVSRQSRATPMDRLFRSAISWNALAVFGDVRRGPPLFRIQSQANSWATLS